MLQISVSYIFYLEIFFEVSLMSHSHWSEIELQSAVIFSLTEALEGKMIICWYVLKKLFLLVVQFLNFRFEALHFLSYWVHNVKCVKMTAEKLEWDKCNLKDTGQLLCLGDRLLFLPTSYFPFIIDLEGF